MCIKHVVFRYFSVRFYNTCVLGCTVGSTGSDKHELVAIAFEDVASALSVSVRDQIMSSDMGKTRKITKDFLLPTAETTVISRKAGTSKCRKCSVVWLDTLPEGLQSKLRSGMFM